LPFLKRIIGVLASFTIQRFYNLILKLPPPGAATASVTWRVITQDSNWQSSIRGLVEVCRFLLCNGSGITNGSDNVESIFHRKIFHQGFQLNEEASRKAVFEVLIKVLKLLSPEEKAVRNAVNNNDYLLNSPMHIWAAIALKSPQDYTSIVTGEYAFEGILRIILSHFYQIRGLCSRQSVG
jgi:hypothetical protein